MTRSGLRHGALLLPLALVICGDSLNVGHGCGPGPKPPPDPTIRVELACTLEARGAEVRTYPCFATWERQPAASSNWVLSIRSVEFAVVNPSASLGASTVGVGETGITYTLDGLPLARLDSGFGLVVTGAKQGYRACPGCALDATGGAVASQVTLTFTSVMPPSGTIEAVLVPMPFPPDAPSAGPAGTSVTLTGTFQAP